MTTLFDEGEAIRGDRILINARRLSKPKVVNQPAHGNVYCIIEKPLSVRPKQQARGTD